MDKNKMFDRFKKYKRLHKNLTFMAVMIALIMLLGCKKLMLKIKLIINNPSKERLVMVLNKGQIFTPSADGNYSMQNFCLSDNVLIDVPPGTSKSYVLNGFCTDARKSIPRGPAEMTRIRFEKEIQTAANQDRFWRILEGKIFSTAPLKVNLQEYPIGVFNFMVNIGKKVDYMGDRIADCFIEELVNSKKFKVIPQNEFKKEGLAHIIKQIQKGYIPMDTNIARGLEIVSVAIHGSLFRVGKKYRLNVRAFSTGPHSGDTLLSYEIKVLKNNKELIRICEDIIRLCKEKFTEELENKIRSNPGNFQKIK